MRRSASFLVVIATVMAVASTVSAEEAANPEPKMHEHQHMGMSSMDGRELVNFPMDVQAHLLGNMRSHMEALNGIIRALANNDFEGAAQLAEHRLGLDLNSAQICRPKSENAPPLPKGSMAEMMSLYMPEAMKTMGYTMHKSASDFAVVALTHDPQSSLEALSKVTQNCVACHSSYRIR